MPDVTFFPHTLLPLHVFEARYRVMVIDALERDRRLAVVKLKPGYEATYAGKPEVHPVAGLGEIREQVVQGGHEQFQLLAVTH